MDGICLTCKGSVESELLECDQDVCGSCQITEIRLDTGITPTLKDIFDSVLTSEVEEDDANS